LAAGISARLSSTLSPAEGRRFGLTVGVAFLALGAVSRWRGHDVLPIVAATLGGALVLAGLVVPGRLGPVYVAWMRLALAISKVTTPVLLGFIYFIGFTPLGLLRRALGKNALVHPARGEGYWTPRPPAEQRSDLQRQF
jgi:hypothetical protein